MHAIPFEHLGFSRLFVDFIRNADTLRPYFPHQAFIHSLDGAVPEQHHPSTQYRSALLDAISATMQHCSLTPAQNSHLAALQSPTALTITTGQQAGFLGGALYTMLKAFTALAVAQHLKARHPQHQIVPIFWIEDNDHDINEVSRVVLINAQGDAQTIQISWDTLPERIPVSDIQYDFSIESARTEACAVLQHLPQHEAVLPLITTLYTPGTPIVQAFVGILQAVFGEHGMLFVSAAELRRRGLFRVLAEQELSELGASEALVQRTSEKLISYGYHAQAHPSPINFFLHSNGKRHKLQRVQDTNYIQAGDQRYTHSDLRTLAQNEPERFSPSVLLRPIAQDALLPNLAYIAGPGELAYLAQARLLYSYFGVHPAVPLARHSATLVDYRTARICEKLGVEPQFFLRRYSDVERDILRQHQHLELSTALDAAKAAINQAFRELLPHVTALDPTLSPSTDRTRHQALQSITELEIKIRKAQKRIEEATLNKVHKAATLLFPHNALQERALPYLYFVAVAGFETISSVLQTIAHAPATAHYLCTISAYAHDARTD